MQPLTAAKWQQRPWGVKQEGGSTRRRRGHFARLLAGAGLLLVAVVLRAPTFAAPRFTGGAEPGRTHEGCKSRRRASEDADALDLDGATTDDLEAAKKRFFQVFEEKGRDTSDPAVVEELENLEAMSPTKDPALSGDYLCAEWTQVSKFDYSGKDGSKGYTLGQLSFNMFVPNDLLFVIDHVWNVQRQDNESYLYDVNFDLTCIDDRLPGVKARMMNFGRTAPAKDNSKRLEVEFTGGVLQPAKGTSSDDLAKWIEVFQDGLKKSKWSLQTILFKKGLLRLLMGLKAPDKVIEDGTMRYEMSRAPHGYLDILYLDDTLRITRGNRGSVIVVTRDS